MKMRALHLMQVADGSTLGSNDRLNVAVLPQVDVTVGGGAGEAVVVAVVIGEPVPGDYAVLAEFDQDVTYYTSDKTARGFNLHVNPRLAASTVAVGKVNLFVVS